MPSDSASFRVGASWSPEMIAICWIPAPAQPLDDRPDFRPDGRLQFDRPAQVVVDAHHHHGGTLAVHLVQGRAQLGRQGDALPLQEPPAADADGVPLDLDGDAVTDLVL